ncbi:hypothetical protein LB450_08435 [Psychroflexus sp. CAK1W]|nr:hypothetical protein [Psychroflexus curvus]MBZ9628123.1 hypothetical protein [Psychroflexus curvus]
MQRHCNSSATAFHFSVAKSATVLQQQPTVHNKIATVPLLYCNASTKNID